jgi:putative FmdB family regulatory protein
MPKYEYACRSCSDHIEVVQSFADDPLTECPQCGGVLRKVFSAPGIAFKGSGFYRTDNRKRRTESKVDAKADGAKTESTSDSGGDSKSGGDAKPADKSDGPAKKESAPAAESKPKAAEAKTA